MANIENLQKEIKSKKEEIEELTPQTTKGKWVFLLILGIVFELAFFGLGIGAISSNLLRVPEFFGPLAGSAVACLFIGLLCLMPGVVRLQYARKAREAVKILTREISKLEEKIQEEKDSKTEWQQNIQKVADLLKLKEAGILTEEEFEEKKNMLL